jgi:chitinase
LVTINGDLIDEMNETFNVTLYDPVNATIGDGTAVGTILDDDPP